MPIIVLEVQTQPLVAQLVIESLDEVLLVVSNFLPRAELNQLSMSKER